LIAAFLLFFGACCIPAGPSPFESPSPANLEARIAADLPGIDLSAVADSLENHLRTAAWPEEPNGFRWAVRGGEARVVHAYLVVEEVSDPHLEIGTAELAGRGPVVVGEEIGLEVTGQKWSKSPLFIWANRSEELPPDLPERDGVIRVLERVFETAVAVDEDYVDVEAQYNEDLGEFEVFWFRTVVAAVDEPDIELSLAEGRELDPECEVGDSLGVVVPWRAALSVERILLTWLRKRRESPLPRNILANFPAGELDVRRELAKRDVSRPPAALEDLLAGQTGAAVRPFAHFDFGRDHDPRSISVVVPEGKVEEHLTAIRDDLPRGWVSWRGTPRWLGYPPPLPEDQSPVELAIGPGVTPSDMLLNTRVDAINFGHDTEAIVPMIVAVAEEHGLDIRGASTDTVWFTLDAKTLKRELAEDLAELCPDIPVDEHLNQIDEGTAYCWWD